VGHDGVFLSLASTVEKSRGCRKTLFQKIRENNFASRFDLSDVFEFKDILHPPNFGLFGAEREFFNSHACLQQLTLTPELPVTRSELKSA